MRLKVKVILMQFLKNLKIKDKILITIILIALIFIFIQKIFFSSNKAVDNRELTNITVGDTKIMVEIAETADEKYKGLSFRENLADNEGMLFLHERIGTHEYVMRDMNFNLDFIFIKDEEIVDIAKNVTIGYKGVIKGATTYNKILEVPANWTDKNNIELGGKITIN